MRLRWIGLQLEHMQRAHVVSIWKASLVLFWNGFDVGGIIPCNLQSTGTWKCLIAFLLCADNFKGCIYIRILFGRVWVGETWDFLAAVVSAIFFGTVICWVRSLTHASCSFHCINWVFITKYRCISSWSTVEWRLHPILPRCMHIPGSQFGAKQMPSWLWFLTFWWHDQN